MRKLADSRENEGQRSKIGQGSVILTVKHSESSEICDENHNKNKTKLENQELRKNIEGDFLRDKTSKKHLWRLEDTILVNLRSADIATK